jgi:acyl-CoA dehydrogenase
LVKKQLMKIMLPTEQALSMYAYTAHVMNRANQGEEGANQLLRILTPLYKFRACRDNIRVATGAMEMRGGNGYIEDFVNARLVRDAHVGVLWEGTSNIAALDAITRAVGKMHSHEALAGTLKTILRESVEVPENFRKRLDETIDKATAFATEVASREQNEDWARVAAGALYHLTSAVLMAWEASRSGHGKRLLLSRMILEHRLSAEDPLMLRDNRWESRAADLLLRDSTVSLAEAVALVA